MTILYKIDNNLYVNLTNKCTCACTFCLREIADGVHGSDNLWLDHDISLEEALKAFEEHDLEQYESVVFCGYGEPLIKLEEILGICKYIRAKSNIKIRINTNGLANLTHQKDVPALLEGYVDSVSISLNAPDSETYMSICRPRYKEKAFDGLLEFAKGCKEHIGDVVFSVVEGTIPREQIEKCQEIADDLQIKLRVREAV